MDDQVSNLEVGAMKMQVFYETMQELLSEPEEERDSYWAYRVCQQTRFAGQKIFECFPDVSEVEGLLNMLEDLPGKVKNAKNVGPYKDHLHEFAGSVKERLDEMSTYVAEMSAPLQERPEVTVPTKGIGQIIRKGIHRISNLTASHKSG